LAERVVAKIKRKPKHAYYVKKDGSVIERPMSELREQRGKKKKQKKAKKRKTGRKK
jgi:hypothetical protein